MESINTDIFNFTHELFNYESVIFPDCNVNFNYIPNAKSNILRLSKMDSLQIYNSSELRHLLLHIPTFYKNVLIDLSGLREVTDISCMSGFRLIDVSGCPNLVNIYSIYNVKYLIARHCKNLREIRDIRVDVIDLFDSNINILINVIANKRINLTSCKNIKYLCNVKTHVLFNFLTPKFRYENVVCFFKPTTNIKTIDELFLSEITFEYPIFKLLNNEEIEIVKLSPTLSLKLYKDNFLQNYPYVSSNIILDLQNFDEVTDISHLSGYCGINISGCNNIKEIKNINNVTNLYAMNCNKLKKVENVNVNSYLILNNSIELEQMKNISVGDRITILNCNKIKTIENVETNLLVNNANPVGNQINVKIWSQTSL